MRESTSSRGCPIDGTFTASRRRERGRAACSRVERSLHLSRGSRHRADGFDARLVHLLGRQDEGDAIRAIHAAIDKGVNWIDTAPFYGWGRAEEIVGRAVGDRRDRVLLFTKCGTMSDGAGGDFMDLSPAAIRGDVERSLRRLGTDRVDLLQYTI